MSKAGLTPFPTREAVRESLADNLLIVLSSRLLPKKKSKGRLAAYEVLRNSAKVSKFIKRGAYAKLKQYLKPSLKSSITKLKREGKIA